MTASNSNWARKEKEDEEGKRRKKKETIGKENNAKQFKKARVTYINNCFKAKIFKVKGCSPQDVP